MIDLFALVLPVCLVLLLAFSTKKDRAALWIVTISNLVGWLLVVFVTRQIHAPWKLAIPAAGETLTIFALITIGGNRSSFFQAICLLIAWLSHVLCYVDCETGSNLVYDHYEKILDGVAFAQLLGFHDSALNACRTIQRWVHLWATGGRIVSPASSGFALVHNQDSKAQTKAP